MIRPLVLLVAALSLASLIWGYAEATSEPVVRRARVGLSDWPQGAAEVKALLISDIHVGGPDMPPKRLGRIVHQINALAPDVVLITGDLVSDKRLSTRRYTTEQAVAPLRGLRARLGVFAVLGNHDHWRSAEEAHSALRRANVTVLENGAASAGPLAIGGLDDPHTGRSDVRATLNAMRGLDGAKLLISHSPDPFPNVPSEISLMLAGHTHCGQIAPPPIGPIATMSRYGTRYACGLVREQTKTLIVSAGVGTSILPLRVGARPDLWLIQLGPPLALRPAATH